MENSADEEPFGLTDTELHFGHFEFGLVEYPGSDIKCVSITHEGKPGLEM